MEICVTDAEFQLLTEILHERRTALLREIAHTDHFEFKHMLKERLALIDRIMEHMGIAEPVR